MHSNITSGEQDVVIAGGLITSPAWASWLTEFNEVLTTLSLVIGLLLGVARLWRFLRQRYKRS